MASPARHRPRRPVAATALIVALVSMLVLLATPGAAGAATQIDSTGCGPATTAIGTMTPPAALTTPATCVISFRDTAGTSSLALSQQDAAGTAVAGIPDYALGAWAGGASAFGACLEEATGSIASVWTPDGTGTCTITDADPWYPVPTSAVAPAAIVATSTVANVYATVDIRFGVRVVGTQAPGSYSAPLVFTVVSTTVNTPPTTPTNLTPAPAVIVASTTPTLTADFQDPDASDTGRVQFQVCTTALCGVVLQSGDSASGLAVGATGSWTVGAALSTNTTYYWRVRGEDAALATSGWSAAQSFTVNGAPGTATLDSPANAALAHATPQLTATFVDSTPGDSGLLRFEVCPTAACASVLQTGTSPGGIAPAATGSWTVPVALTPGTTYHWRARGEDAQGATGTWSATRSFVANTPPIAPNLQSPAAAAIVTSTTPNLVAQFNDPDAGTTGTIHFQVCADAACTSVVGSGSSAAGILVGSTGNWTTGALTAHTTYYWRARGEDSLTTLGPWTATWAMTINGAPSTPTLVTPTAGATGVAYPVDFDATFLDSTPGDTGLVRFQLCSNITCASVLETDVSAAGLTTGSSATWTSTVGLSASTTYYWRAQGQDASGVTSAYSAIQSFTTGLPPAMIVSVSQASGTTSVVVPKPAGTVNGDRIYAFIAMNDGLATLPAGWGLLLHSGSAPLVTARGRIVAGASEPANYTFTTTSSGSSLVILITVRGGTSGYAHTNGGGTDVAAPYDVPAVFRTFTAGTVGGYFACFNSVGTWTTAPASWSERIESSATGLSCSLAAREFGAAGDNTGVSSTQAGGGTGGTYRSVSAQLGG